MIKGPPIRCSNCRSARMEQDQSFFLFCCAEQYSINFPNHSLSSDSSYFVRYRYPDETTKDAPALVASEGVLLSQSPEYDHPCTVNVSLHATIEENTENITEFSLDLVSPVEYLFRKFSANEFDMSDKISDKMTSALLAMSLSYYYVMEEHVEKETRTDEILSTLLNCSKNKVHTNTDSEQTKGISSEDSITKFAQQYKLQNTLQYLSGGISVGDLPVQLPKPFCSSNGEVLSTISQQTSSDTVTLVPTHKVVYDIPNNKPLSECPPTDANEITGGPPPRPHKPDASNDNPQPLPDCDYVITEPPPRPPKPDPLGLSNGDSSSNNPATISQISSDAPASKNIYNIPSNKPLPGSSSVAPDQVDYEIAEPLPVLPKPDPSSPSDKKVTMKKPTILSPLKSDTLPTGKNLYNIPNNRPVSGSSQLVYDQEGYVDAEASNRHTFDDSNLEEYILADQTDSSKVRYVEEPVSRSSNQSPNISKSPAQLPRVKSATVTGTLVIDEEYEMCDSASPVEKAAEEVFKKERGPPPKIPTPYLKSRSLDRSGRHSVSPSRNYSASDLESSLGSPRQEASSPGPLKPPPRRKFSIHKPKTNKKQ